MKKTLLKSTLSAASRRRNAVEPNAQRQPSEQRASAALMPSFKSGSSPAKPLPRARRLHTIKFSAPLPMQFAMLEIPAIAGALKFQRRAILVRVAEAILSADLASLNQTAKLLNVPASWLCDLLRRWRAGGDKAIYSKVKTHGAASGCRLSIMVRTS